MSSLAKFIHSKKGLKIVGMPASKIYKLIEGILDEKLEIDLENEQQSKDVSNL